MLSSPWISGVKETPFFFVKDLRYMIAVFKKSFKKGLPCCAGGADSIPGQGRSACCRQKNKRGKLCHTLIVKGTLMMRTDI